MQENHQARYITLFCISVVTNTLIHGVLGIDLNMAWDCKLHVGFHLCLLKLILMAAIHAAIPTVVMISEILKGNRLPTQKRKNLILMIY